MVAPSLPGMSGGGVPNPGLLGATWSGRMVSACPVSTCPRLMICHRAKLCALISFVLGGHCCCDPDAVGTLSAMIAKCHQF